MRWNELEKMNLFISNRKVRTSRLYGTQPRQLAQLIIPWKVDFRPNRLQIWVAWKMMFYDVKTSRVSRAIISKEAREGKLIRFHCRNKTRHENWLSQFKKEMKKLKVLWFKFENDDRCSDGRWQFVATVDEKFHVNYIFPHSRRCQFECLQSDWSLVAVFTLKFPSAAFMFSCFIFRL